MRKLALIIGNSQYEDAGLAKLAAPDVDVRALAEVLKTPGIGAFDEVKPLLNEGLATVRKAIARFFDLKHRDDLLLLYFSGHGVRDEQGHLYLAVRDTERAILAGTAIEASYVTTRMDRSASKRLVLVLDCCHSGAFGYGSKAAQGAAVGTASAFEGTGRGRVVLTATDSTQYAWEGDRVIGDVENSLFTHYMIEGLRTGAADRDEDGLITIDELYDYVYDHVLNETPKQTPGKWAFGQQGEIVIAQNPSVSRAKLPAEIEEALNSKLPSVRLEAVHELENILKGRHPSRALAAREALQRLAEDDSRRVATAALDSLKAHDHGIEPTRPEPPALQPEKEPEEAKRLQIERDERAVQVAAHVADAQSALARGALDEAREPLAKALQLEPQDAGVLRLQQTLQRRIEERTRLEEAERHIRQLRQRIATLIARANAATEHDEAIALLNEALGLDPEHAELKELLEARLRQRADAERIEQRRREAEEAARQQAKAELRRREAAEAARQKAEAERRAREEQIAQYVAAGSASIRKERFAEALDALSRASQLDPNAAGLTELIRTAETGKAAAETEARKRQEIESQLSEASRHRARENLTKAIILTEAVLRLDPDHAAARTLHADLEHAIEAKKDAERQAAEEREQQRQIDDMIATAEAAATPDTAVEILRDVLARDPANSKAQRLLKKRQADVEAARAEQRRTDIAAAQAAIEDHISRRELGPAGQELDAAEGRFQSTTEFRSLRERLQSMRREKEQHDELERLARAAVAQAREDFARGDHQRAITDLNRFTPPHAIVSEALRTLKAQADEIRRVQREQQERARLEAERAARQDRVTRLVAGARAAIGERRFQEAAKALEELRALAPDARDLPELHNAAQAGLAAEQAAALARREIDQTLERAAKRFRRRDYTGARALVDSALARDGQHPAALTLRAEIQRASDEQTARPPGFSLRPTLSTAIVWLRTTALGSSTFRIAAGVVLAVGLAAIVWMPSSELLRWTAPDQAATQPAEPSSAAPELSKEPDKKVSPPPAPSVEEPKPETPAANVAVGRDERLVDAERRGRQQLDAGNAEDALRTLQRGLGIDANDSGLQALLNEILRNAQARAARASKAVEKAGTVAFSSKEFAAAKQAQADADGARYAGRHEQAIRGYWEAARLFGKAAEANPAPPASPPTSLKPPEAVNPPSPTRSDAPSSAAGRGGESEPAATRPPLSTGTEKPVAPLPKPAASPPAAAETTTSPSVVAALARKSIDRTLQQYKSALESRSVDALKAVWPTMPRDIEQKMSRALGGYRSQTVELSNCSEPALVMAPSGTPVTATMTCHETNRVVFSVGGGTDHVSLLTRFSLRAVGSAWVIDDLTRNAAGR